MNHKWQFCFEASIDIKPYVDIIVNASSFRFACHRLQPPKKQCPAALHLSYHILWHVMQEDNFKEMCLQGTRARGEHTHRHTHTGEKKWFAESLTSWKYGSLENERETFAQSSMLHYFYVMKGQFSVPLSSQTVGKQANSLTGDTVT